MHGERRQRIRGAEDVRGCGVMKVRGGTVFLHGGTGCRGEGAAGVLEVGEVEEGHACIE